MRSLWSVTHAGNHTANTLQKMERLMNVKALDTQRERFRWQGEDVERVVFFVDHGGDRWADVLTYLLGQTSKLAMRWQASGDAVTEFSATLSGADTFTAWQDKRPSGLREVTWTLRADQTYRVLLLTAPLG
jgi:hypothetical protein